MKNPVTSHNAQIIAAHSAEKTHKTELTHFVGVSPLNFRRVLAGAALIVATAVMIQPAEAALSSSETALLHQYFNDNPLIPGDKQNMLLGASDWGQVENWVNGNTYYNGTTDVRFPPMTPPSVPLSTTLPATTQPSITPPTQQQVDAQQNTAISDNAAHIAELETQPKPTNGIDGKDGAKGDTGAAGADGKDGAKGDTGAAGADGKDADMNQVHTAQQTADHAQTSADTAKANAEGLAKQMAVQNGDKIQGMLHAKTEAEINAAVTQTQTALQAQQEISTRKTSVKIAAQDAEIKTIEHTPPTPAQNTTIIQQQVRSPYYDQQINALNAQAEQNHAEVLSESHARASGDAQTLQQSQDYTNHKFSDLKSQVDDNKKQAAAGSASAMAQANIPQVQESQQFAIGAGIGGYDSENALSVGASFHAGRATIVKMSVSNDTQSNFGYGAGVSVGW